MGEGVEAETKEEKRRRKRERVRKTKRKEEYRGMKRMENEESHYSVTLDIAQDLSPYVFLWPQVLSTIFH